MKPRFMATALPGSPQKNVDRACRVMIRNFPEAPVVPRLTQSMRVFLEKMPCIRIDKERRMIVCDLSSARRPELLEFYEHYLADDVDYFAISPELHPCLNRLAEMYREKPWPELKVVHYAMPGPYTLGISSKDERNVPAFYDDEMRDIIVKQLTMKAKWIAREIRRLFPGVQVLLHFAEPGMVVFSSSVGSGSWDEIRNCLDDVLSAVDGVAGVHCCSNFDWSLLMRSSVRSIDFDAYRYGETMALYALDLTQFLARGGTVGWGIVPTGDPAALDAENGASLAERLERILHRVAEKGVDRGLLMESSWVTPSCDVTTLSEERGERVYALTREVSERMRAKYFP